MKWSTSLLVLVVVAAHVIAASSALECYFCETNLKGACSDDFDGDKVGKCNGDICVKHINKDNVRRGCMSDVGKDEECLGDETTATGRICYCKHDKCNTAVQSVSSIGPLTALGFVAFTALAGQLFDY